MRYKVEKGARPAYLQIYMEIKEDIVRGILPYGSKLPSKRLLADETETSTVTIEHAYALLCDEGYIEAKERSGFFVIFFSSFQSPIFLPSQIPAAPRKMPYPAACAAVITPIMMSVGSSPSPAAANSSISCCCICGG